MERICDEFPSLVIYDCGHLEKGLESNVQVRRLILIARRLPDDPVSPGTVEALNDGGYFDSRPQVPPKDSTTPFLGSYSSATIPSQGSIRNPLASQQQSSANEIAPWDTPSTSQPARIGGGISSACFQDDEEEEEEETHPGVRPNTGRTDTSSSSEIQWPLGESRPSFTSTNTGGSSQASIERPRTKNSRTRKFTGLLGNDSHASSGKTTPTASTPSLRARANSYRNQNAPRAGSPSRPITPGATSDVAPWEYQVGSSFFNLVKPRCSNTSELIAYSQIVSFLHNVARSETLMKEVLQLLHRDLLPALAACTRPPKIEA